MDVARKLISVGWTIVPPILLSALIHTTDPDVGGVRGLSAGSVWWSILFFSVPAVLFALVALVAFVSSGWPVFLVASTIFSALVASVLTVFGSGATTPLGLAWTFLGSGLLVFLFLVSAVVPSAAFGWPKTARQDTP